MKPVLIFKEEMFGGSIINTKTMEMWGDFVDLTVTETRKETFLKFFKRKFISLRSQILLHAGLEELWISKNFSPGRFKDKSIQKINKEARELRKEIHKNFEGDALKAALEDLKEREINTKLAYKSNEVLENKVRDLVGIGGIHHVYCFPATALLDLNYFVATSEDGLTIWVAQTMRDSNNVVNIEKNLLSREELDKIKEVYLGKGE